MYPQPAARVNHVPSFGTLERARSTLRDLFDYPDFRAPQLRAVEAVLSGRDALIVLPTGGGKSLCYQVPALVRSGLTIVVSPLISLMKDQVDALTRRGIGATFVNSTLGAEEVANRMARVQDGSMKLLYLAPERMEAGRMVRHLAQIGVSMLAVDEAHCISEWGHDFRPSYRRIGVIRERLNAPQTVALTATATPAVREDITRQLNLRDPEVVVGGFDRTNLTYFVVPADTQQTKDRAAVDWLRQSPAAAVVYTPTRKEVERVTATLVRARINAVAYHGGLHDAIRQNAQNAFMSGRARVIVATSAFGMGIDKPDVRLVVHHAMPGTLEAYYQEAGRAGRDGKPSTCVLLYSAADRSTHEFFIANAQPSRRAVEEVWRTLRHASNDDGFVALSLEALASRLRISEIQPFTAAAVRVLVTAGIVTPEAPAMGRVLVRLLATPERITRELVDGRASERELLRTLWRRVGERLYAGVTIDLDQLPRRLGGSVVLVPALDRLRASQFVAWSRLNGGFRVDSNAMNSPTLPIDWDALARKRQSDIDRLDAVQGYAQTHACRRAFVLRYFGDPETRSHCAACDRCIGSTVVSPDCMPGRASSRRSRLRRT